MDKRDALLKKMKKLDREDLLDVVAREMGTKPLPFMLKNSLTMLKNAVKNGWIKSKDIFNAVDGFSEKTHMDDTDIDWDTVEIAPNTTKMRFLLTKDIVEALQELKEDYKEDIKDIETEGKAIDDSVRDEMKKRGLKMSDEEMKTDATLVVNTMSAKENKNKSGKELKKEIENKKKKIAKVVEKTVKRTEEQRKAAKGASSSSSKDSSGKPGKDATTALTKKQVNASLSKCKESMKQSLVGKYGSGLKVVASSAEKVKQTATKNLGKNLNKIQENNIIATKLEFPGSDRDSLLAEKKDKTGYVVKPIKKEDTTLYSLKQKIVNVLRKELKGKGLGKVSYAYYRHWNGENPKNKLDSIYVFIGISVKSKVNEDITRYANGSVTTFNGLDKDEIENLGVDTGPSLDNDAISIRHFNSAASNVVYYENPVKTRPFRQLLSHEDRFLLYDLFKEKCREYHGRPKMFIVSGKLYDLAGLDDAATPGSLEEHTITKWALKQMQQEQVALKLLSRHLNGEIRLPETQLNMVKYALFSQDDFCKTGEEFKNLVADRLRETNEGILETEEELGLTKSALNATRIGQETGTTQPQQDTIPEDAKKSSGLFKSGTWFGWVRLGTKTAGYVLNHGQSLIDKIAAVKIKHQEDKNLFAEARFLIENENLDKEYADSLFSVRFSLDDMKWHATNMDDRKMKIDEQKLIDKFKNSNVWKKFSETALQRLDEVTKDSDSQFLLNSLANIKDSKIEDFQDDIKTVLNSESEIRKEF